MAAPAISQKGPKYQLSQDEMKRLQEMYERAKTNETENTSTLRTFKAADKDKKGKLGAIDTDSERETLIDALVFTNRPIVIYDRNGVPVRYSVSITKKDNIQFVEIQAEEKLAATFISTSGDKLAISESEIPEDVRELLINDFYNTGTVRTPFELRYRQVMSIALYQLMLAEARADKRLSKITGEKELIEAKQRLVASGAVPDKAQMDVIDRLEKAYIKLEKENLISTFPVPIDHGKLKLAIAECEKRVKANSDEERVLVLKQAQARKIAEWKKSLIRGANISFKDPSSAYMYSMEVADKRSEIRNLPGISNVQKAYMMVFLAEKWDGNNNDLLIAQYKEAIELSNNDPYIVMKLVNLYMDISINNIFSDSRPMNTEKFELAIKLLEEQMIKARDSKDREKSYILSSCAAKIFIHLNGLSHSRKMADEAASDVSTIREQNTLKVGKLEKMIRHIVIIYSSEAMAVEIDPLKLDEILKYGMPKDLYFRQNGRLMNLPEDVRRIVSGSLDDDIKKYNELVQEILKRSGTNELMKIKNQADKLRKLISIYESNPNDAESVKYLKLIREIIDPNNKYDPKRGKLSEYAYYNKSKLSVLKSIAIACRDICRKRKQDLTEGPFNFAGEIEIRRTQQRATMLKSLERAVEDRINKIVLENTDKRRTVEALCELGMNGYLGEYGFKALERAMFVAESMSSRTVMIMVGDRYLQKLDQLKIKGSSAFGRRKLEQAKFLYRKAGAIDRLHDLDNALIQEKKEQKPITTSEKEKAKLDLRLEGGGSDNSLSAAASVTSAEWDWFGLTEGMGKSAVLSGKIWQRTDDQGRAVLGAGVSGKVPISKNDRVYANVYGESTGYGTGAGIEHQWTPNITSTHGAEYCVDVRDGQNRSIIKVKPFSVRYKDLEMSQDAPGFAVGGWMASVTPEVGWAMYNDKAYGKVVSKVKGYYSPSSHIEALDKKFIFSALLEGGAGCNLTDDLTKFTPYAGSGMYSDYYVKAQAKAGYLIPVCEGFTIKPFVFAEGGAAPSYSQLISARDLYARGGVGVDFKIGDLPVISVEVHGTTGGNSGMGRLGSSDSGVGIGIGIALDDE